MTRLRQPLHEVLCFSHEPVDRGKVRRYYAEWRRQEGLPDRCDNPECRFHNEPLIWNGEPFKPILDHVNGNNLDNQAKNLRYLCPNCDSQLDTRGGANKGRVKNVTQGGYQLHDKKTGRTDTNVFAKTAKIAVTALPPIVTVTRNEDDDA